MVDRSNNTEVIEQRVAVPMSPGAFVEVLAEVKTQDPYEGFSANPIFTGTVEEFNPETGKLSFEENETGYSEFLSILEEGDGVKIINDTVDDYP